MVKLLSEPVLHARGSIFEIQISGFRMPRGRRGYVDRLEPLRPESGAPLAFQFRVGLPALTAGRRSWDRSRRAPDARAPDPKARFQSFSPPAACAARSTGFPRSASSALR